MSEREVERASTVLPGVPLRGAPLPVGPVLPEAPQGPVPSGPEPGDEPVAEQELAGAGPVESAPEAIAPVQRGRHQAPGPETASRRRPLVLIAVVALVLAAAVVVLFVTPGLLVTEGSPGGSAPSSAPTASTASVTLATPPSAAGMTRLGGAPDAALRAQLSTSPVPGLTGAVSAVYGTKGTPRAQVIAWKAANPPPQDSVDAAFTGFEGSAGTTVAAVRALPAGELGGHMACGTATVSSTESVLCFWADDVSFGSITLLSPESRADAEAAATAIRAAVEIRS